MVNIHSIHQKKKSKNESLERNQWVNELEMHSNDVERGSSRRNIYLEISIEQTRMLEQPKSPFLLCPYFIVCVFVVVVASPLIPTIHVLLRKRLLTFCAHIFPNAYSPAHTFHIRYALFFFGFCVLPSPFWMIDKNLFCFRE